VVKLVEASVALACAEGEQGVRAGVDVAVRERKEGSAPEKGKMEILIKGIKKTITLNTYMFFCSSGGKDTSG
jgi:hypothetical protein